MALIEKKDLKVKHLSGEYMNLPSAPEPEDIVYYMVSKKKKQITKEDLVEFFGEEKNEIINQSLEWLEHNNMINMVLVPEEITAEDEDGLPTGETYQVDVKKFELIKDAAVA